MAVDVTVFRPQCHDRTTLIRLSSACDWQAAVWAAYGGGDRGWDGIWDRWDGWDVTQKKNPQPGGWAVATGDSYLLGDQRGSSSGCPGCPGSSSRSPGFHPPSRASCSSPPSPHPQGQSRRGRHWRQAFESKQSALGICQLERGYIREYLYRASLPFIPKPLSPLTVDRRPAVRLQQTALPPSPPPEASSTSYKYWLRMKVQSGYPNHVRQQLTSQPQSRSRPSSGGGEGGASSASNSGMT